MAWLDYWFFLPWALYDGTALRVLIAAAAAIAAMALFGRKERHRLPIAADLRVGDLP